MENTYKQPVEQKVTMPNKEAAKKEAKVILPIFLQNSPARTAKKHKVSNC